MLEAWRTFRRLRPEPRWRRRLAPPREAPPAGEWLNDSGTFGARLRHAANAGDEIRGEAYATAEIGTERPRPSLIWVIDEDGERHELGEIVAGSIVEVWLDQDDSRIRDQDGVEPIGERNQCWRCWAKAVDEGDELGLCDRCKADLKDPETGPDEATNLHAIAERYSARDLLKIALGRRAAGELIPETVIDGLLARAEFEAFLEDLRDGLLDRADEDGYDNRAGG